MSRAISKKLAGRHTSYIEAAESIIKAASSLDIVTKIITGEIKQVKAAPVAKSLKISEIPVGIKVRVRGPKTVQVLYIHTTDRRLTASVITEAFNV